MEGRAALLLVEEIYLTEPLKLEPTEAPENTICYLLETEEIPSKESDP
jgi:hypothetical protein